ncbi:uncharacterized protein LOC101456097 [Ceratitis capitata]|uniref:(Mediterranean fruit fly) hypothetical protein n=1 Tax=Ceratitis capitata TaxID=7213 RepID=A0A811UZG2_CERCA|nr:uncharacterized protein LOC101456097 [Ceratitis capitata]CAD7003445.1 unnamed protein product [Ceratitis capitata]
MRKASWKLHSINKKLQYFANLVSVETISHHTASANILRVNLNLAHQFGASMVIQRNWKILSDGGSSSASSTEANRSPIGLQSSSDDSNCSNQTTHSMATSVASPHEKLEVQSSLSTVQQMPTIARVAANNVTSLNVTKINSHDSMKYVTTIHMSETLLQRLRQRLSCQVQVSGTGTTAESAVRSLELLRISIQKSFNHEIDVIIKQYMETYFKPALKNIKENLGQNIVSEEVLQKMTCALLENAKAPYILQNFGYGEANSLRFAVRRPLAKPVELSELPTKKLRTSSAQQHVQAIAPSTAISITECSSNMNTFVNSTATAQLPLQRQIQTVAAATPIRRQIFWNTAHISTTTKFVLDVQANQAFGFGTDGKERLTGKHPELIRYLPDNEDREWLCSQNLLPVQNRDSRILFLIYDEVCRLKQTHEIYRAKTNIDLNIMNSFTLPEYMVQKIKQFFVNLNIKSRGLITNSFSVTTGPQGNSHLRNALLQGVATQNNNINIREISSSNMNIVCSATTAETSFASNTNVLGSSNHATSSSDISALVKPSTLSSSHATLTALLNNSTNPPTQEKSTIAKLSK